MGHLKLMLSEALPTARPGDVVDVYIDDTTGLARIAVCGGTDGGHCTCGGALVEVDTPVKLPEWAGGGTLVSTSGGKALQCQRCGRVEAIAYGEV